MRILYCDDSAAHRSKYKAKLEEAWEHLLEERVLSESLRVDPCSDIVVDDAKGETRSINEIAEYDAIMLDILWVTDGNKHAYGVEIARRIRTAYPEKPILMLTVATDPQSYNNLLDIGICGYLSKAERDIASLCLQINAAIEKERSARSGLCLYKLIRQCVANNAWESTCVGKAASAAWRYERPRDRWAGFWGEFVQPLANYKLGKVFEDMGGFFADADLLALGSMPDMRGHLEHVLSVYFTGYVISNTVPQFREQSVSAARRLFPDDFDTLDADNLWDQFQLAWLAAATLHDVAYPLELLPNINKCCSDIWKRFAAVVSNGDDDDMTCPSSSATGEV